MAVGYVLISVIPGKEFEVFQTVQEMVMVEDATLLFGDYDLVIKVAASDMSEIARLVVEEIRQVDGVTETKTLAGAQF